MEKYDDISWHLSENDQVVPESNGAAHIAFYVSWLLEKDFINKTTLNEWHGELGDKDTKTPVQLLMRLSGGKLLEQFMTDEAARFSKDMYNPTYLELISRDDLGLQRKDGPSAYTLEDTWDNSRLVAKQLDDLYEKWTRIKGNSSDTQI